jgi:hypothetical protein
MAYDAKTAERVRAALADQPDVVEKRLMGGLCFMVGGSMCCSVSGRGGLLVRIVPDTRDWMLAEPHVAPMRMRGRVMRGFVRRAGGLPDAGSLAQMDRARHRCGAGRKRQAEESCTAPPVVTQPCAACVPWRAVVPCRQQQAECGRLLDKAGEQS